MSILQRVLGVTGVWAIPARDGRCVFEVRRLGPIDKFVVVECQPDGGMYRVDSKRGMSLERAKARATWLAEHRVAADESEPSDDVPDWKREAAQCG